MNERTLSVVLIPVRESKSLGVRFRDAVVAHLTRLGVPRSAIEAEALAMSEVAVGPTASRSLLGCLREAAFALSLECENPRFSSLAEIELYFSEFIYSTTNYRYPRELVLELLRRTLNSAHCGPIESLLPPGEGQDEGAFASVIPSPPLSRRERGGGNDAHYLPAGSVFAAAGASSGSTVAKIH